MKQKKVYVTKDGKEWDSVNKATDHALEMAHIQLISVIKSVGPKYEAYNEAYELARKLIFQLQTNSKTLREVLEWLEDSEFEEEGEYEIEEGYVLKP